MRRFQKEKIFDLIKLMFEGHDEAKNFVKDGRLDNAYSMLCQCQECAIQIGTLIEKTEKDKQEVIKKIEDYCESLYTTSQKVYRGENINILINNLNEQLQYIERYIREKIEIKYEIVFLPYKACMWDSMESIWEEAYKDEECNAYVIPIKYIEFNSKREVAAIKYEGGLMPDYVPVTDYHKYDFAERRPDVIYIHNPYDQYNRITSIDPRFYSSELKKVTDMLVFVPYFVSDGVFANTGCIQSVGVLHADKVILESEKIREEYIKVHKNIIEKNGSIEKSNLKLRKLKEKFLTLGSPKLDKAIKNNTEVPKEWQKVIKGRRVIIYNTHILALTIFKEDAIEKFKYVFNIFKDNKDFVLLWRPHPLSEQAIVSMEKGIINKYKELIRWYKEKQIGIYDDSSDLDRALSVCDAYLGDHSSLITLVGVTGKPIMLESMKDFNEEKNKYEIYCEDWVVDDDFAWFSAFSVNGLFKMNLKSKAVELVGQFPWYKKNSVGLYSKIIKLKNKLILAPSSADCIAIYDIDENKFLKIDVDERYKNNVFISMASYEEFVFFIGRNIPVILRLDMRTYEVTYITELEDEINKYITDKNAPYFEKSISVIKDCFYIPLTNLGLLLKFNMRLMSYKLYKLGKGKTFSAICYDGENSLWISPRSKGAVVRFDLSSLEVKEFENYPDGFENSEIMFSGICYQGGYVWLLPSYSNMLIKMNVSTGRMECVKYFERREKENKFIHYYFSYVENNCVKLFSVNSHDIVHFDENNNEIKDFSVRISEELREKFRLKPDEIINGDKVENYVIHENNYCTIKEFLEYVRAYPKSNMESEKKAFRRAFCNSDGSAGKKIHQCIKKQIK